MKKIVIQGGEFYKLFEVYNETKEFAANQQTALMDIQVGKLYRVEVSNITDRFSLYNGEYLAMINYGGLVVENGKAVYTVRAHKNGTLYMRYVNGASNVNVVIFEIQKYGKFKYVSKLTTAEYILGEANAFLYVQPIPVSGKTYHIEIEFKYDGDFALYGSDNVLLIPIRNVSVGTIITYDYTAVNDNGYVQVRMFGEGKAINITVNEI